MNRKLHLGVKPGHEPGTLTLDCRQPKHRCSPMTYSRPSGLVCNRGHGLDARPCMGPAGNRESPVHLKRASHLEASISCGPCGPLWGASLGRGGEGPCPVPRVGCRCPSYLSAGGSSRRCPKDPQLLTEAVIIICVRTGLSLLMSSWCEAFRLFPSRPPRLS